MHKSSFFISPCHLSFSRIIIIACLLNIFGLHLWKQKQCLPGLGLNKGSVVPIKQVTRLGKLILYYFSRNLWVPSADKNILLYAKIISFNDGFLNYICEYKHLYTLKISFRGLRGGPEGERILYRFHIGLSTQLWGSISHLLSWN